MKGLTKKQQEILSFINKYLNSNLQMPTLKEIADNFSVSAVAIHYQLQAIQKKGFLTINSNASRGIILNNEEVDRRVNIAIPFYDKEPGLSDLNQIAHDYCYISRSLNLSDPYAFKVSSESMKDSGIMPGDIAIMDNTKNANNGDIVLAYIPDSPYKPDLRVYIKTPHVTVLQSDNESIGNITSTSVSIIGVLKSIRRNYS